LLALWYWGFLFLSGDFSNLVNAAAMSVSSQNWKDFAFVRFVQWVFAFIFQGIIPLLILVEIITSSTRNSLYSTVSGFVTVSLYVLIWVTLIIPYKWWWIYYLTTQNNNSQSRDVSLPNKKDG